MTNSVRQHLPFLLMLAGSVLASCQSGSQQGEKTTIRVDAAPSPHADPVADTIARLVAQLRDDPDDADAIGALVALGEVSIPGLRQGLEDEDGEFRMAVVQALSAIRGEASFDTLLAAIQDEDEGVRLAVVEGLGEHKNPRALPNLLEVYKKEQDDQVRYEILTTLGLIGDPSVVPMLMKETTSENHYIRMWSADALCELGVPESIDVAAKMLADPNMYVRQRILAACAESLTRPDAQAGLIHLAINGASFDECVAARRNLQKLIATPGSEQVRDRIKTVALAELDGDRALYAGLVLADLNDPSGIDVLRSNSAHPNSFVRHHVAFEIGRLGDEKSVPVLVTMLDDPDELVAATAHDALLNFVDRGNQDATTAVASFKGKPFPVRLKDVAVAQGANY